MAVSFLVQPDRHPLGAHPATRRPQLVGLDGGRSVAAVRRRRVFLVRRLVVGVLALVAIVLAGSAVSAVSSALSPDVAVPTSFEVAPGDTLWSIAGELGVDADRREVVQLLSVANGGTVVVPGQHLQIPESVRALGA